MKPELITLEHIKSIYKEKGYIWFTDKVNIGGVRTNNNDVDRWNDFIFIEDKGKLLVIQGTTRPGKYWLEHPTREAGTFVMVPGQYIDCWRKGFHTGYPALVQCRPIKGWRDSDRDSIVDPDQSKIYIDGQGVNIHHAHKIVKQSVIDKYSAGCQVICAFSDWNNFFEVYSESLQDNYSYTLITENDFIPRV